MAANVLTITSGKGGVGKTTTVANIAVALAAANQKVVCIDGDIGLRNLDVILGLENRIVYDIVDIVEGRCRTRQAMIRDKRFPELFLIPAAQTRDKNAVSPSDMVRLCNELRDEFDWIIIDSPAGIERGFKNSIAPADIVAIVTNPEMSAVRDADRVIGIIESEGKKPPYLIINRIKPAMVEKGDMLSVDDIYELLRIDIIGIVPEDENVIIASNKGMPLTIEGKTRSGQAFRNIARRFLGEEVPFMDLKESNFWKKIHLFGQKDQ